ncbi:anti-sigma factor antagonist [Roseobacter denitrificans]|uniref:Anti-sigma factor antagonist n=1 Tax=Roseobacter denitrificans (strain ATCC 33942 / OCh 114) TaxID=375451 RepID=Q16E27_ROSDO|nr:STAS domain-containing protein [Roseobacter denitrificans]ABG29766.1 anti-anti-sigma factor, putative [Roseobacter denitrificans OCh 114]AVL54887.1 anti-sigma factor antagonist [Roseobacter denitrificans]SFG27523.1 anti-sigma-factor antagonist [Roseobacter denitrificans OCh 114]
MELASKTEEQLRIVSVQDTRIDAAVAIEFKDAMRVETDDGPDLVVLDLSRVEFIDSSGLGAIVAAMKHMGKDRKMALAGLTPTVERVFTLTRMDSVFSVFPTLEGALAELKPQQTCQ